MSKQGKHNRPLKELGITPVEKKSVIEGRFSFTAETAKMLADASNNTAVAIATAAIESYGNLFSSRSFTTKVREAGFKGDSAILSKTFTFVRKREGHINVEALVIEIDKMRADKVKSASKKSKAEKHLAHLFSVMKKSNDIDTLINIFETLLDGGKVIAKTETDEKSK